MLHEWRDDGNGWLRLSQVSKSRQKDTSGINTIVNEEKEKKNAIVLSSTFWRQIGSGWNGFTVSLSF